MYTSFAGDSGMLLDYIPRLCNRKLLRTAHKYCFKTTYLILVFGNNAIDPVVPKVAIYGTYFSALFKVLNGKTEIIAFVIQ